MSTSSFTELRVHPRHSMNGALGLSVNDQQLRCRLNNISISAVSVTTDQELEIGETVTIEMPGVGELQARVVRVSGGIVALSLNQDTKVRLCGIEELARALG